MQKTVISDEKQVAGRTTPKGLIVIPARLQSSRLPRKLLLCETGQPLLAHVIQQAQLAMESSNGLLSQVVVAADDELLCDVARTCGVQCVMTKRAHRNGTSRIAEAVQTMSWEDSFDFVVNLQADQPELAPTDIVSLARQLAGSPEVEMTTLAVAMGTGSEKLKSSPEAVKVVIDAQNSAMYFSRSPIPFGRTEFNQEHKPHWYFHVGIYAYRIETLLAYKTLPDSQLAAQEGLEQLSFLESGMKIKVVVLPESSFPQSVDTHDDYSAFVKRWTARCRTS